MGYLEDRAQLIGRRAIIVGGGGGLGQACAVDLAGAGVNLALCDRDPEGLAETGAMINALGTSVITEVLDARDPDALGAFFETADVGFDGGLDVLINVVGGTFRAPFEESSPKAWDALMRTNFVWLLASHQLAIPRMRRAGKGSIINFTSIEAHRAAPGFAVYAAMKAAVASLTATLAVELAPEAIRVNCIAPDITRTPSMSAIPGGPGAAVREGAQELQDEIAFPMGRTGVYADIGGCALFLASDLSSYVTGTTIHPDGGTMAAKGWYNWPSTGYLNFPPMDVIDMMLDANPS